MGRRSDRDSPRNRAAISWVREPETCLDRVGGGHATRSGSSSTGAGRGVTGRSWLRARAAKPRSPVSDISRRGENNDVIGTDPAIAPSNWLVSWGRSAIAANIVCSAGVGGGNDAIRTVKSNIAFVCLSRSLT